MASTTAKTKPAPAAATPTICAARLQTSASDGAPATQTPPKTTANVSMPMGPTDVEAKVSAAPINAASTTNAIATRSLGLASRDRANTRPGGHRQREQ